MEAMSWFYAFIIRLAMGERWRKATPSDNRLGAGLFFLIAVYFGIGLLATHFSRSFSTFMQKVSPIGLWLSAVAVLSVMVFVLFFWARHVTTRISAVLAVIAWAILLGLVFYLEWLPNI
jgi:hypothetical protein